jgi:hypothetical protein
VPGAGWPTTPAYDCWPPAAVPAATAAPPGAVPAAPAAAALMAAAAHVAAAAAVPVVAKLQAMPLAEKADVRNSLGRASMTCHLHTIFSA